MGEESLNSISILRSTWLELGVDNVGGEDIMNEPGYEAN